MLVALLIACGKEGSSDEVSSDTGTGDGDTGGCVDGNAGCPCYPNGTCNEELVCTEESICAPADCVDGIAGCPCYGNGTCDPGLECSDGTCVPDGGDGDTTGDGDSTDDGDTTGDGDATGDGDTTGDGDSTGDGDTTGDGDGDCGAVPDDMVCVPAGTFEMGTDLATYLGSPIEPNEKPAHEVTLTQTYWFDKYEVTAEQYALCWGAQACTIPSMVNNQFPTWAVAGKENHPINGVDWYQSRDYCEWVGKNGCPLRRSGSTRLAAPMVGCTRGATRPQRVRTSSLRIVAMANRPSQSAPSPVGSRSSAPTT